MRTDITREECEQLKERFYAYCHIAEQYEFIKLYIKLIKLFKKLGKTLMNF